jgi:hypothetical protein
MQIATAPVKGRRFGVAVVLQTAAITARVKGRRFSVADKAH